MVELEVSNAQVCVTADILVDGTDNNVEVSSGVPELDVTVNRKEYSIVGDELYIPKRYEDAPAWLQALVDQTILTAIEAERDNLNNTTESLNTLITELEVAKNTYTQSIIGSNDIDSRINTAVTTLNSTLGQSIANVLDVAQTATTPDEVRALVISGLSAELEKEDVGTLGAIISSLEQAVIDGDSANATSIESLEASLEAESINRATAVNTINAYVGIDNAGASTGTGLSAYLEGADGTIGGAESKVANNVYVDSNGQTRSTFEYQSLLNIDGQYYNSGFGLVTSNSSGSGTELDPYSSEFWINAEKLKFTNSNMSGQATPFTIDATGTQPKVTFNGLVTFGSGQTGTIDEALNTVIAYADSTFVVPSGVAAAVNSNTTTIDGSKITTGSIDSNQIRAYGIDAGSINTHNLVADFINSANTIEGNLIKGAFIEGSIIKNSWIDLSSVGYITNWQGAMDIENPASIYYPYRNNFASDTDGFIVDSSGYYRLPGVTNKLTFNTSGYSVTADDVVLPWYRYPNTGFRTPAYDSYKIANSSRPITINPSVGVVNGLNPDSVEEILIGKILFLSGKDGRNAFMDVRLNDTEHWRIEVYLVDWRDDWYGAVRIRVYDKNNNNALLFDYPTHSYVTSTYYPFTTNTDFGESKLKIRSNAGGLPSDNPLIPFEGYPVEILLEVNTSSNRTFDLGNMSATYDSQYWHGAWVTRCGQDSFSGADTDIIVNFTVPGHSIELQG